MNVRRLQVVAAVTLVCVGAIVAAQRRAAPPSPTPAETAIKEGERKTSTDPAVNPDAAVMAEFKARVETYADLHKKLAKGEAAQKETSDPARIADAKAALAAKIQAARAGAKHGDIFTPAARPVFRRLHRARTEGRRRSRRESGPERRCTGAWNRAVQSQREVPGGTAVTERAGTASAHAAFSAGAARIPHRRPASTAARYGGRSRRRLHPERGYYVAGGASCAGTSCVV